MMESKSDIELLEDFIYESEELEKIQSMANEFNILLQMS